MHTYPEPHRANSLSTSIRRFEVESRLSILGVALIVSALIVTGCSSAVAESTELPVPEPRPVVHSIELREGQTHTVALAAEHESGGGWEVESNASFLELVARSYEEATGEELFTFRALAMGTTEVCLRRGMRHKVICVVNIGADPTLAHAMTEAEAREIAKSCECGESGTLKDTAFYNDWTATWWIDLDAEKDGCRPACVVSVRTRQAEINWRCTGGLPPAERG